MADDANFYSADPFAYNDKIDSGLNGRITPDEGSTRTEPSADAIFEQLGKERESRMQNKVGSPDLKQLYERYKRGDRDSAYPLLTALNPTIDSALKSFTQGDNAYRTKARVLAMNAVNTYDPSKGASLQTHVYNNLQRLQRISAQRAGIIRMPENAALQRRAIEKAREDIELETGEEPTLEELADRVGLSIRRINKLMTMPTTASESQFTGDTGDMWAKKEDHALDLYDRYIYEDLDRTDKKIYEWSTGYGGTRKLSRKEMARKLGISEAAVSLRSTKIAQKFSKDRELIRSAFMGTD